jgi:hypothetical protein
VEPPAPAAPPEGPAEVVEKKVIPDRGLVLGFEAGYGSPRGTAAQIYGPGFGTGLVVGFHWRMLSVEWHFHHSYALTAKDAALRGETTQGELSASTVLARVRLLDVPMVEVMGGPAVLNVPVLAVGEDDIGNQRVEGRDLRGLGIVLGAAVGYRVTREFAICLDVRAVVASKWELPGDMYVVPGDHTPDGGLMYTEAREDASARPVTATLLLRVLL